eukprot:scaffold3880_cov79-Skeletonema_dohrnii-CCMP3373.AAC.2
MYGGGIQKSHYHQATIASSDFLSCAARLARILSNNQLKSFHVEAGSTLTHAHQVSGHKQAARTILLVMQKT